MTTLTCDFYGWKNDVSWVFFFSFASLAWFWDNVWHLTSSNPPCLMTKSRWQTTHLAWCSLTFDLTMQGNFSPYLFFHFCTLTLFVTTFFFGVGGPESLSVSEAQSRVTVELARLVAIFPMSSATAHPIRAWGKKRQLIGRSRFRRVKFGIAVLRAALKLH